MIQIYLKRYEESQGKNKRELEHHLGKSLLCKGLKDLYGIIPDTQEKLLILEGEHGKPYLKEFPDIHYNISHSNGLVVCGIGDRKLGIDVERIRPFRENLQKKVLSDEERHRLKEIQPEGQNEYFFRLWTLKESYVKAIGCGITIPLKNISFEWKDEWTAATAVPGASFYQTILDGGYVLSVCTFGREEIKFVWNAVSSI